MSRDPDAMGAALARLDEIADAMASLDAQVGRAGAEHYAEVATDRRASARNLVHYLAMRQFDIRELQSQLAEMGLSSLGRAEAHVAENVNAVRTILATLLGRDASTATPAGPTLAEGVAALNRGSELLLGAAPAKRQTRIMVTMPGTAASDDGALIRALLDAGMDLVRINCAHDGPEEWAAIIRHTRTASQARGRACKVLMDLEGPKARTGAIAPGPRVVRWNPRRDVLGRVERRARVLLALAPAGEESLRAAGCEACLPLSEGFLRALATGDVLRLMDARGLERELLVVEGRVVGRPQHAGGERRVGLPASRVAEGEERETAWIAEADRAAYVIPGTVVRRGSLACTVEDLPAITQTLTLFPGDELVLSADPAPGTPREADESGRTIAPARIPFTLPEALASVRAGERVLLDDGKAEGVVVQADAAAARVRMTRCRPDGFRLGPDKGVNLPDTALDLAALSADDRRHLRFIAAHADLVGYSFVHRRKDVLDLLSQLDALGGTDLGIVLKIETARAFANLPDLLLAAMRRRACGVMIARGDLAVECGYERLAEVQEEILWLCEAAHVPVIWATQVLETLAKKGLPSRSEITDAAMGQRAECVMLNKGPHVVDAVRLLDDILSRMADHQSKKRSMLRPLSIAQRFRRE